MNAHAKAAATRLLPIQQRTGAPGEHLIRPIMIGGTCNGSGLDVNRKLGAAGCVHLTLNAPSRNAGVIAQKLK